MTLGAIIGGISLALLVLGFALCATAKRADDEAASIDKLEQRFRAADPGEADFAGDVVPFKRSAS